MTFLPRPTTAACGFACALLLTLPGCESPAPPAATRGPSAGPVRTEIFVPAPTDPLRDSGILRPVGVEQVADGVIALSDGRTRFGWGVLWQAGRQTAADFPPWKQAGVTDPDGLLAEPGVLLGPDCGWGILTHGLATLDRHPHGVLRLTLPAPGSTLRIGRPIDQPGVFRGYGWPSVTAPRMRVTFDAGEPKAVAVGGENWSATEEKPVRSPFLTTSDGLAPGPESGWTEDDLDGEEVADFPRNPVWGVEGVGQAAVRDVTFRPETVPLPLTAFTPVPGNAAKITREEDTLRLTGGPGFLCSENTYGDFVLQCEVKLHAPDSNSGLFFRTVEPTEAAPSNGYEVQLQNTLGPGGRTDPDDYGDGFGTGGIFRRQPARYVNADDGEWFHLTLICVGNRMATWVNGLQVTDFTDDREPDPNPRQGRRDEAGYLVLQGHDPTTDVSFRNVRVQELASE